MTSESRREALPHLSQLASLRMLACPANLDISIRTSLCVCHHPPAETILCLACRVAHRPSCAYVQMWQNFEAALATLSHHPTPDLTTC